MDVSVNVDASVDASVGDRRNHSLLHGKSRLAWAQRMEASSLDITLQTVQHALQVSIKDRYPQYVSLLESFLGGRITKEEVEGALRVVLEDNLIKYDLHNKFVGLVLEKLSEVEGRAMAMAMATSQIEDNWRESATLELNTIQLSSSEQQLFTEATERELIEAPFQGDTVLERFQLELAGCEKLLGKPLLCQISGCLPDVVALRAIFTSWLRAYELDPAVDEEHVALLAQGLEDYLGATVLQAKRKSMGADLLKISSIMDSVQMERCPIPPMDSLLYPYRQ
jgi:hypothetical protein